MINAVINYLIFSALSSGVSFLIVIYMTRHISVEDFGVVGLFMSILYILPQFISFSSCSGLTNCSGLIILDIFQTITQCHFYAELPP